MISLIRGTLLEKHPPHLIVDVQGIGYEVEAPMSTFYDLPACGKEISLFTHFTVREDAHILYGFGTQAERALFRMLLKVNGVGGKLALTILSGMDAGGLKHCIVTGDRTALIRLPGVGKKMAERLVIELRDRLDAISLDGSECATSLESSIDGPRSTVSEAIAALEALGYKSNEAQKMVNSVQSPDASSEELIRLALRKSLRPA